MVSRRRRQSAEKEVAMKSRLAHETKVAVRNDGEIDLERNSTIRSSDGRIFPGAIFPSDGRIDFTFFQIVR